MKKSIFMIKVLIISGLIYSLLSTFFLSSIFIGNPIMSLGINIISFILIIAMVAYLLIKNEQNSKVNQESQKSSQDYDKTSYITIFSVILVLMTLFIPTTSTDSSASIVYLSSIPLMIVGLIIVSLLKVKFRNTKNWTDEVLAIFFLVLWAGYLFVMYEQFILSLNDYLYEIFEIWVDLYLPWF